MKRILAIIVAAAFSMPCFAAKVIGVLDGDTLDVLENGKALRIRLANIDAPEKSQPFGQASKKSLSDMCYGKDATYTAQSNQSVDKYGRTIAVVKCAGVEVNRAQVERGMAWVYANYNKDVALSAIEAKAKASRGGLWHDAAPVPPWEFRHNGGASASASAEQSTCHVGPRGGHYRIINGKKRYGC